MEKEEIEFMKLYVALLYKYGYCYYDVSKEYLDEYLHQLKKIMEAEKIFEKYENSRTIFEHNEQLGNYENFINLILYVTESPKYSFIDKKTNIIMLNLSKQKINEIIKESNFIDLEIVDKIVNYMINYLNFNLKIKMLTKK